MTSSQNNQNVHPLAQKQIIVRQGNHRIKVKAPGSLPDKSKRKLTNNVQYFFPINLVTSYLES